MSQGNVNYRYEQKFVVDHLEFEQIRKIILFNGANFKEAFPQRTINNIYFDSLSLQHWCEHMSGVSRRRKYRVRWYGNIFGEVKKPKLEIKIKRGQVGTKRLFNLPTFDFNENFSLRPLFDDIKEKTDVLLENVQFSDYVPTLLNSYDREYYISADKLFRITLDREIKYFRINNLSNTFMKRYDDSKRYIVELKYDVPNHQKACSVMQGLPFRLTKNSKYMNGLERLNS